MIYFLKLYENARYSSANKMHWLDRQKIDLRWGFVKQMDVCFNKTKRKKRKKYRQLQEAVLNAIFSINEMFVIDNIHIFANFPL